MRETTKIGNETGASITVPYFTDFERLYREYDKQLHANGWDKLKENNKFLESYELLNWLKDKEKIDLQEESELAIKDSPSRKVPTQWFSQWIGSTL